MWSGESLQRSSGVLALCGFGRRHVFVVGIEFARRPCGCAGAASATASAGRRPAAAAGRTTAARWCSSPAGGRARSRRSARSCSRRSRASLLPWRSMSRTWLRRSTARSALLSAMVWFWHTRQRSSTVDGQHALFKFGVGGGGRRRAAGLRRGGTGERPVPRKPPRSSAAQAFSSFSSGSMRSRSTCGVSGPTCLKRTTPWRSMTKVSGTP